jgi:methyl-accepting chemotaxis protein
MTPLDKDGKMYYYISAKDNEGDIDPFTEEAPSIFDPEIFEVLKNGNTFASGTYDSESEYGLCVTGYAPVTDSSGNIVAVVGIDKSVDGIMSSSFAFIRTMVIVSIVILIIAVAVISFILKKSVSDPISDAARIARIMASGGTQTAIPDIKGDDEIAELARAFISLRDSAKTQSEEIERIASGDLNANVTLRGEGDSVGIAVGQLEKRLRELIRRILECSTSVSKSAGELDDSSSALAGNESNENVTINALKSTADEITAAINESAKKAEDAAKAELVTTAATEKGKEKMQELSLAVEEIKDAGTEPCR